MSLRNVQQNAINQRHMATQRSVSRPSSSGFQGAGGVWRRNPSWLTMPSVLITDQKIVILTAVRPKSEFVAFTLQGAYTVDWGDGSSPVNVASNTAALYLYNYTASGLNNTDGPVTFTASGSTVDRTAHGYVNGDVVTFWTVVTTTGITAGQQYYVVNATTNTFQVSATAGGSPITLTNNGSGTLLPYKQAIITITPQAGQNLTTATFANRHTAVGLQPYSTGFLDLTLSMPNATSVALSGASELVRHSLLERLNLLTIGSTNTLANFFRACYSLVDVSMPNTSAVTNMTNAFLFCFSLPTVPLFNTAAVTNMTGAFSSCYSLQTVPLFNTAAVTTMFAMFENCFSLQSVPLFNTAAVTSMATTFRNCYSLKSIPLFNTFALTNLANTFQGCDSLESLPLLNTASVTTMEQTFRGCTSLKTIPLFNTAAVTNVSNMFLSCVSLQTIPLINTGAVTNMSAMFSTCNCLASVPPLNTANVTDMSSMFSGCQSLVSVPLFDMAKVTTTNNMFRSCSSLQTVPLFNMPLVVNTAEMFRECNSLQSVPALNVTAVTSAANYLNMFAISPSIARIEAKDFRFTFTLSGCKLGAAELDEIYTNLPTVTAQTITVSNNHGTTGDTPSIATAKGWTVTG